MDLKATYQNLTVELKAQIKGIDEKITPLTAKRAVLTSQLKIFENMVKQIDNPVPVPRKRAPNKPKDTTEQK